MLSNEEIVKLTTKTLYRLLLKNCQYYPSKNKYGIELAMKDEFRRHKNITDSKQIFMERKKAQMGLAHVLLYKEKNIELKDNYTTTPTDFREPLNPKDENFIYF